MIIAVGSILTYTVGWPALTGWGLIICYLPVQHFSAKLGAKTRRRAMKFTDERVKFTTEVVQGIRVAKLCAWEQAIFERVSRVRRSETFWLVTSLFFKAIVREW